MSWKIGDVQSVQIGPHAGPGFTLGEHGKSPSLTLLFSDQKTAQECAALMEKILDKASGIAGR